MELAIKVNGETRLCMAEEEMPPLWGVRDKLQMTGTNFGCGATPRRIRTLPFAKTGLSV